MTNVTRSDFFRTLDKSLYGKPVMTKAEGVIIEEWANFQAQQKKFHDRKRVD